MLEKTEATTKDKKDAAMKSQHEIVLEISIDNVFENCLIAKIIN